MSDSYVSPIKLRILSPYSSLQLSGSRRVSQILPLTTTTTTTEDFAAMKLRKSKMTKADQSKFELENVDLKGFKVKEKSREKRESQELEFEPESSGRRDPIPRPPPRGAASAGMKRSGSMPKLQDTRHGSGKTTEEVLTAAKGLLMKGKNSK